MSGVWAGSAKFIQVKCRSCGWSALELVPIKMRCPRCAQLDVREKPNSPKPKEASA